MKKIRRQKPLKGGRDPLSACLDPAVYRAVQQKKREYYVAGSFIVNSILARVLGVKLDEYYDR